MFEKISAKIQESIEAIKKGATPIDPSQFADPVADQTSWGPLKRGGANFCTHKMKRVSKTRIEFKTTLGTKLFSGIFAMVGVGIMVGGILMLTKGNQQNELGGVIFMLIFGSVFAAAGCGMYVAMSTPTVLDARLGLYWKGRKDPTLPASRDKMKVCVPFADIHAIQLISEWCSGGKNSSSYRSYELNFVLHDGERVNVVDHGNQSRIRKEANQIADLLKIPVWDAI